MDELRRVDVSQAPLVPPGESLDRILRSGVLLAILPKRLADTTKYARPTTVLVVDGTAGVHSEGGARRVLDVIEPLPVGNYSAAHNEPAERQDDTRASLFGDDILSMTSTRVASVSSISGTSWPVTVLPREFCGVVLGVSTPRCRPCWGAPTANVASRYDCMLGRHELLSWAERVPELWQPAPGARPVFGALCLESPGR